MDRGVDSAGVGYLAQPLGVHDRGGVLAGFRHGFEYILGDAAVDRLVGDQIQQPAQIRRRYRRGFDRLAGAVQCREQVAGDPVGGLFGIASLGHGFEITGIGLLGHQHVGIVGGQPVIGDEAGFLGVRQFRQLLAQLLDPAWLQHQRQQVGVGEVAVIMRIFLAAHGAGGAAGDVEQTGFLQHGATGFPDFDLPHGLRLHRQHDEAHRVDVFHLAARAERLAVFADRNVDIRTERAFLHVAVAGAEVAQDVAQLAHVGAGFLGAADIGLADDLHQGNAGAVQIDEGFRPVLVVQRLAGVLLQMQPGDADLAGGAVGKLDVDFSLADDGVLVLADLIAGGQVGVEIVLPVKAADQIDPRVQAKAGAHGLDHGLAVQHRQHAGERGVHEAHLRVRSGAEIGGRPAEQF